MKKTKSRFVSVLFVATVAHSGAAVAKPTQETLDYCKKLEGLAGQVMNLRQSGVAMSEVMAVASRTEGVWGEWIATLAELAYGGSRRDSQEGRNEAIAEFKDRAFAGCLKGSSDS